MELVISQRDHWQMILRRQQLANAERWLNLVRDEEDSPQIVLENYDNLLRALEFTLQDMQTFHLSFALIEALHTVVLGYADWDRWLNYLETALHKAQQFGDETVQARLLELCADVVYQMGDLARAKGLYQQAGHIYERLHDLDNHSRMLIKLSPILSVQGQLAEAIELCRQANDLAQTGGNRWLMAHASLNLSHIQYTAHNWQVGLQAAQKAYGLYRAYNKPEFMAKALGNMITGWARLQEWDKADVASAELLEILTASGDIHTLTVLKNNLGIIAYNQSNYQAAELAWQEALQLAQQMQAPDQAARVYNNLGKLYTRIEEWSEAARMLEEAIGIYQTLGDTYNWANSMDNLADLYEAQGLTILYRETLETAVSALNTLEPNAHVQTLLQTMRQRLD